MALVEELAKLVDLQKVDVQIYQRMQALKELDTGEQLKQQAIAVLKRHDAATEALRKLEAAQKDEELSLKSIEDKRNTVHDKLYSGRVNNPKELGDLEKDEEMLKTQIGRHEETLLGLMDQVEDARTQTAALASELDSAKRRWKETVARTQAEMARLQREIAALQQERERLAARVEDRMLLRRYDDLRKAKEGVGLAAITHDMCSACHVKLTPQTLERLREGEELTVCDNCGRLLAWERTDG